MRYAALILGGLMAASLPTHAQAQSARAAFQDNYADVNGVRLHYASVGKGPLVLFLHGYPSFWYQWKDQMAEMGRDHLAVGLDMRGYNLSSRPEGLEPYKMKYLVEDVRQFAEKVAVRQQLLFRVQRLSGAGRAQTEGYYIVSGGGTMFTDGYIVNGRHNLSPDLNGPTCGGVAYDVVKKVVKAGDIIIVPAGVVHGWLDISDHVDYLSFRPSPGILTAGWTHPVLKK